MHIPEHAGPPRQRAPQLIAVGTVIRSLRKNETLGKEGVVIPNDNYTSPGEFIVQFTFDDDERESWYFRVDDDDWENDKVLEEEDDPVNPRHYADLGEYAAIYIIEKWGLGFNLGQTLKYIQRAGSKPGEPEERDIAKARWYLDRHLHELDPELYPDPAKKEAS